MKLATVMAGEAKAAEMPKKSMAAIFSAHITNVKAAVVYTYFQNCGSMTFNHR
jgi:hypothetical protein